MIGILPAAGKAERMHGLPKYLLPTPDALLIQRHISMMRSTDARIYIGTNEDNLAQVKKHVPDERVWLANPCETMSQTVLSLYRDIQVLQYDPEDTLFGMPDTYIEDDQCYAKLADALNMGADVAVGVFETRPEQRSKLGMCVVHRGRVLKVIDKPQDTTLELAWGALAWKPTFWEHLRPEDPHVGYALPRAMAAQLSVCAVIMDGGYWDCGTPDEYFDLITHLHLEKA